MSELTLTPQVAVAFIALAAASYTDLKDGKIPNALTFPVIALGLVMNGTSGNWAFGLYGLLAATIIHFSVFALGIQRGGDAKLFMAVGACIGHSEIIDATAWYAIVYAPVGFLQLIIKGKLGNLVDTIKWSMAKARSMDAGEKPEPTMLRTAPIIAAAVVGAWMTNWPGLWDG